MPAMKIVAIYPAPRHVEAFERAYIDDHSPMVTTQNVPGLTKFVASRIVGTPDGSAPPFQRIAELYCPSLAALQSAAGSATAQRVVAHAFSISSGGNPIVLVAEEESKTF